MAVAAMAAMAAAMAAALKQWLACRRLPPQAGRGSRGIPSQGCAACV